MLKKLWLVSLVCEKKRKYFFHISIFRLQKNMSMEKIVSHHEKKSLYNHFSVKSVWKWEKLKIRLYKWSFLSTETYKTYLENWCFLLTSTFFYFIRIWFCPIYTIFSLSIHAFHQVNYILKLINLLFPTNKLFFFLKWTSCWLLHRLVGQVFKLNQRTTKIMNFPLEMTRQDNSIIHNLILQINLNFIDKISFNNETG